MYDLNDAQPQMAPVGELIPDGTFAKVAMTIRPGGLNGATPADAGLLKASNVERRQAARLRVHRGRGPLRPAQVLAELHRRRRQGRREGPVEGLEHLQERVPRDDRQRARTRTPRTTAPAAKQKRVIQGLKQLDGIVFVARIMIEPASNPHYKDANKLANVVLPDEPQYAAVMRGESVPPEPVNAKPRKAEAAVTAPAWATPATAAPEAGTVPWAAGAPAPRPRPPRRRRPRQRPRRAGRPAWLKAAHDRGRVAGLRHPRGRDGDRQMARRTWKARPARCPRSRSRTSRRWRQRRSAASSLMGSERIRAPPEDSADLSRLLLG